MGASVGDPVGKDVGLGPHTSMMPMIACRASARAQSFCVSGELRGMGMLEGWRGERSACGAHRFIPQTVARWDHRGQPDE